MLIGLTGQMGCGKTTAAAIFKKAGACVIDADRIGREVVEDSALLRHRLKIAFGTDIFDKRGKLRRKILAVRAFATSENHARLNAMVHPYLLKELRKQIKTVKKNCRLVVVDAALLLDWNLDREMDFVLVVHTSREKRLQWLLKRKISRQDALARLKNQLTFSVFRQRADRVILNSGSVADLKRKINALLAKILRQTD
ncbi:MAG: dephospho-CoA kinase [Candidatus Zixiibacteriota bacterium]